MESKQIKINEKTIVAILLVSALLNLHFSFKAKNLSEDKKELQERLASYMANVPSQKRVNQLDEELPSMVGRKIEWTVPGPKEWDFNSESYIQASDIVLEGEVKRIVRYSSDARFVQFPYCLYSCGNRTAHKNLAQDEAVIALTIHFSNPTSRDARIDARSQARLYSGEDESNLVFYQTDMEEQDRLSYTPFSVTALSTATFTFTAIVPKNQDIFTFAFGKNINSLVGQLKMDFTKATEI